MPRIGIWLWAAMHRWFPTTGSSAYCSFCGRGYKEAGPLVEGFVGSMICSECVKCSADLLAQHEAAGGKKAEVIERSSAPDPPSFMRRTVDVVLALSFMILVIAAVWFALRAFEAEAGYMIQS